ncbi:PHP domain-containing protein [Micromonospora zingiberis]|uniref:PHP domain-containing protein n=1 Tax=Micromonospora zingiberis TaxID=2053011 RepID=A0A4R0GPI9_9ACTN|nr:PHP domain-containing protein [Micromonospora zingiberis]TCB99654.1 PHP domain-containing protein [Micromonospora zingiberis]
MTAAGRRAVADQPTIVDLHLHSRFSDGDESPGDLARRCIAAGLRVAACTDHDTLDGVAEFAAVAEEGGVRAIPGCELTVTWRGHELHCLAYFVDPSQRALRARVDEVRRAEVAWWRDWFDQAGRVTGVPVDWTLAAQKFGADRVAYRGDYLDLFLGAATGDARFAGYPMGEHASFIQDWCRPGKPLHVPYPWRPALADVVGWVAGAGGVTVLAHPARAFAADELPVRFAELVELGVTGVEVWTTWHDPTEIDRLHRLCEKHQLVPTQGSDHHGVRLKPWAPEPGLVPVDAPDPLDIVARLEQARPTVAAGAR